MKPAIFISSVKSGIDLPKRNLEAIANFSGAKNYFRLDDFDLAGYENISWRFLNALGVGNLWVTFSNRENNKVARKEIPVTASFLAVCTKSVSGNYKFQFGVSLS